MSVLLRAFAFVVCDGARVPLLALRAPAARQGKSLILDALAWPLIRTALDSGGRLLGAVGLSPELGERLDPDLH